MKSIPLCEPYLKGKELNFLNQCIKTNWLSESGQFVSQFENKVKDFTNTKYAAAFVNATSSLHLALKVVGCENNNEVIVPTITFIAPINAVIYNNCFPIFMDSDNFFNIDEEKCIKFLKEETYFKNGHTYNKNTKRIIKAIIIVHVWGNGANFDNLYSVCKKMNIKIIEDASESLGTFYGKGKFAGKHSGTIGDIGCISFNTNKIITCGSGGMIITKNKSFYKKLKYLSTQAKNNSFYYVHNEIGYNYRLNNLNAAIGLAQIDNIIKILNKKKQIAEYYKKNINYKDGLSILENPEGVKGNNWMNILKIEKNYKLNKEALIRKFIKNNIEVRPVWKLNHTQKQFKKFQSYNIRNAYTLYNSSLCLPSSTGISKKNLDKVIGVL